MKRKIISDNIAFIIVLIVLIGVIELDFDKLMLFIKNLRQLLLLMIQVGEIIGMSIIGTYLIKISEKDMGDKQRTKFIIKLICKIIKKLFKLSD